MSAPSQRVVKVSHTRCRDYDGTEYFLAMAHWHEDHIVQLVEKVRDEMIEDAKKVRDAPEQPGHSPPYNSYPGKTVAEVQALHDDMKRAFSKWREENKHLTRSFSDRLSELGFFSLWSDEADMVTVDLDWNHNHNLTLNYQHSSV